MIGSSLTWPMAAVLITALLTVCRVFVRLMDALDSSDRLEKAEKTIDYLQERSGR